MYKILSSILYYFVRALNSTYHYQFSGLDGPKMATKKGLVKPYIFATWHQNLLPGILAQFTLKIKHAAIVSSSKDGELVAHTLEKLGNIGVKGSSTRGGREALKSMVTYLKEGIPGAITIDGPKGPAREVKKGIIEISKLSHAPIIPYIIIPQKYWFFKKSWDEFRIPKPFSKIFIHYGQPLYINKEASGEDIIAYSKTLKKILECEEEKLKKEIEKKYKNWPTEIEGER